MRGCAAIEGVGFFKYFDERRMGATT